LTKKYRLFKACNDFLIIQLSNYRIDGNAYFAGAQAFDREKNKLVSTDEVKIELICDGDKCILKTNAYDLVKDFKVTQIDTDVLGEAFEPGEKYENTDGTPIILNEDYAGNKRGLDIVPGPFAKANPGNAEGTYVVWNKLAIE